MSEFNNDNTNNEIKRLITDGKLEDLHPYKQNLIKRYNIPFNTYEGFKDLSEKCSNSIFLNYYADAQFTIIKKYYEIKNGRKYTDEEMIEYINSLKLRFWYKLFSYSLDHLDGYDRLRIYRDFEILRLLYERGAFITSQAMEYILLESSNFNFDSVADKYTTILNIKNKSLYDSLGLQSYIESVVPSLLTLKKVRNLTENNHLQ